MRSENRISQNILLLKISFFVLPEMGFLRAVLGANGHAIFIGFPAARYTIANNGTVCIETLLLSSPVPVFVALRRRTTTLVRSHLILSVRAGANG